MKKAGKIACPFLFLHLTPQELADFLKLRQAGSPTEALPREQEEMNED